MPSKLEVLRNVEPDFILDYCRFGGLVRQYATTRLEEGYGPQYHEVVHRYHTLNIVAQEYGAYEDAAAMLKALFEFRTGKVEFPLVSLMNYRPGEAVLDKVLEENGVSSPEEFLDTLRPAEWVPKDWSAWFPKLDITKGLALVAKFFVDDCRSNHRPHAIAAFNKIKHGLLVLNSAKTYVPTMPDVPACLIRSLKESPGADDNPFTVYAFPMDPDRLRERARIVYFVQVNLRLLLALYGTHSYHSHRAFVKVGGPKGLFESQEFHDVRHVLAEVTEKR